MPVKQQYIIATAIIALMGVMALFAMFDLRNDRDRFGAQGLARGGYAANAAWMRPSRGPGGASVCGACGWQGICPRSGRCPSCRWSLFGANGGFPVNGAFGPNGAFGANGGFGAGNAGNAGLFWTRPPAYPAPPQAASTVGCSQCGFRMTCNWSGASNGIRCPRCPAYLVAVDQTPPAAGGFAAAPAQPAQPAAWGRGYGRGLNPFCPVR